MPNYSEIPVNTGTEEQSEQQNNIIYKGEKIRVYGIPFEHGPVTNERVDQFRKQVLEAGAYGLIGEYFGPDNNGGELLTNLINRTDFVFTPSYNKTEELEQLIKGAGLDTKVICLDPCHDASWITIDGVLLELPFPISILTATATISTLNLNQQLSRRKFLKALALGSVATTLLWAPSDLTRSYEMSHEIPINTYANPQALRRLIVAGGILDFDKKLTSVSKENGAKVNLALCYPPVHIQGIQEYLNNWTPENERAANSIRSISDYNVARIFSKNINGEWKKQILRLK